MVLPSGLVSRGQTARHPLFVRLTHWLTVAAFLSLLVSGIEVLISHPRFYWGETGNVGETPLFVIPIPSSRDTVPTGYDYVLPDQNGWSRYLHFQSAWLLTLAGGVYLARGLGSGHLRRA
ncbi:MAG TPA: cytochrome b/b6 domain-containing protein, partial [Vicinamibacterales bacterium]